MYKYKISYYMTKLINKFNIIKLNCKIIDFLREYYQQSNTIM